MQHIVSDRSASNKANKVCHTNPLGFNACLFTYFKHACMMRILEREEQVISGVTVRICSPCTKTLPSMQHRNNSFDMPHTFMQAWAGWGCPRCCCSLSRVVRMCLSSCCAVCCCCSSESRAQTHQKHKINIEEHAHKKR
jgi:hypothetical protein